MHKSLAYKFYKAWSSLTQGQICALLLMVFFHPLLLAQNKATDDEKLKEELKYLQAEAAEFVTVASKKPQKEQNAPAILTVISEKEILNSGARNLMDVLRLVPGFDFGVDVENIMGASIRGNWAYEGGILILVDGLEMNERVYGTTQFGQHYPIDNIQKIEVMRGPGSVIYGGFARLGVVNIITKGFKDKYGQKNEKDPDELAMIARYGQMAKSNGHQGISFYSGKNLTDDARITISGETSQAHRSDRMYTDVEGHSLDLAKTNTQQALFLNVGFRYQDNLRLRFIMDDYRVQTQDFYVQITNTPVKVDFKTLQFDMKYRYDFNNSANLNFHFNYSQQQPWKADSFTETGYSTFFKMLSTRYLGGIRLDYAINDAIHITSGLDFTHEEFENFTPEYFPNASKTLPIYENFTPYIESLITTDWGNLTLGLRYDKHNTFESNLAPRIAFTNTLGDFHYKLLYSSSFRIPMIGNYLADSTHSIIPEHTKSYEIELGYQLNKNLSCSTNAFYLATRDKLVYGFNSNNIDIYFNAHDKISTIGVETELRWKDNWGYVTFNHSYSQMLDNLKDFQPIQQATHTLINSNQALAFPAHKLTLNAHYEITPSFSVNPSLVLTTSRYGYDRYDAQSNLVLRQYSPELLTNVFFRYQNALFKGLELGVGAYNLFNAQQQFIQPYNAAHAPLPGQSREAIFKLSYQL